MSNAELGFGVMRMPMRRNAEDGRLYIDWDKCEQILDEYMKGDFCYFDTHPLYMEKRSHEIIRRFVVEKYPRERFLIADKMPYYVKTEKDYELFFHTSMQELGIDYFDYYLLHAVTKDVYETHTRLHGFEFIKEKKKAGLIRHFGISFHDSADVLEQILREHPEIEFVQLQLNYYDWESPVIQSRKCYEVACRYNKEIMVMEPVKGGSLASDIQVDGKNVTMNELVRYALAFVGKLPNIKVVLSGMAENEHVTENRMTMEMLKQGQCDYDDFIYAQLRGEFQNKNAIACTSCKYCMEECPKGIRIPDIFTILNNCHNHGTYDRTFVGRNTIYYNGYIRESEKAHNCIGCGKCERRCPQKLPVRKHLRTAMRLFEKEIDMQCYTVEKNAQMLIYLMKEHGIKRVVLSPGTTNICFAYSVQQDGDFEVYSAADERSAAYIACGLAAESGEPVAISCTGATASRNYVSGLTEAYYRKLPVLAVTCTQPRSRVGNMYPQQLDRSTIQKDIAKTSVYVPMLNSSEEYSNAIVTINRALLELRHNGGGPVHIDLETAYNRDFSVRELPPVRVIRRLGVSDSIPETLYDANKKIGIYVGSHKKWNEELTGVVDEFCERFDAVVICDQTSNYKGKYGVLGALITSQEQSVDELQSFDIMIHMGDVSGAYLQLKPNEVWRVNPDGQVADAFRKLTYTFEMEEICFFRKCCEQAGVVKKNHSLAMRYQEAYADLYSKIPELPFSNLYVARRLSRALPKGSVLHLGILNSLRSYNFFDIDKSISAYSNTGGFGIDGNLSSLIGASLFDADKLYFCAVGDLAFFYDMNSLGNRHVGKNLRILLISNGCGTEFKNYSHMAYQFGNDADAYIAAAGHYGNKSRKLVRDYVENLGFCYMSASTKEELDDKLGAFTDTAEKEQSIVLEVFTNPAEESNALKLICSLNGEREKAANAAPKKIVKSPRYKDKEFSYVLWGTGKCFEKRLSDVQSKVKVTLACDNNADKWGKEIATGITCISPTQLADMNNVYVIIMLEKLETTMQVTNQLLDLGITNFDCVANWLNYKEE